MAVDAGLSMKNLLLFLDWRRDNYWIMRTKWDMLAGLFDRVLWSSVGDHFWMSEFPFQTGVVFYVGIKVMVLVDCLLYARPVLLIL